jgi:hypothetical protein
VPRTVGKCPVSKAPLRPAEPFEAFAPARVEVLQEPVAGQDEAECLREGYVKCCPNRLVSQKPWVQDCRVDRNVDQGGSTMKFNAIRVLQLSAAAAVLSAFAYSGVAVAEKAKAPPACRTITTEAECTPREDCTWRDASVDKKSGKEKRRASCAAKPKAKAKTKT